MAHFRLLTNNEIFESPMHEENGVSIGDVQTYLLSRTAAAALNKARPAGTKFIADCSRNRKWYRKFCEHADQYSPEYVSFARGTKNTDRWYARAVSF